MATELKKRDRPHPGDVVRLTVRWGSRQRNQCLCRRYLSDGSLLRCSSCGTGYRQLGEGVYEVLGD